MKKEKPRWATLEDIGKRVSPIGRLYWKGEITGCNPESKWCNVAWDWESYSNPHIDKHGKEDYPVWGYYTLDELILIEDD